MPGLGLGPSSPCCPFTCGCMDTAWPSTLYLTDPIGTVTLTRGIVGGQTMYRYLGTRSVQAYEYCSSTSLSTLDIYFEYKMTCVAGVLDLLVGAYRCLSADVNGNAPFDLGWNPNYPNGSGCNVPIPSCFSAPSPVVYSPGSLVKNRTVFLHYNYGACVTITEDVQDTTYSGFNGCYQNSAGVPINASGEDVIASTSPGILLTVGPITPQPTTCSSVVSLSLTMSLIDNFPSSLVTITS